jgi:tetratricopeptide (TPR) repeat protein
MTPLRTLFFGFPMLYLPLLCGGDQERALLNSLDPYSVSQHLAFYELYEETPQGREALARAWKLLGGNMEGEILPLLKLNIQAMISLITRQPFDTPVKLSEEQLTIVSKLSSKLANRPLKGSKIWTKEELLPLLSEEIDLGRALLLYHFTEKDEILQYEATLDLIALQILARLPEASSPEEKIKQLNRFIFQEMQFRFPPHSIYAHDIDLYTFLPSVLDSRQGVCLGVSILYLCLAQRLSLPLEIITPPGHIYLRYTSEKEVINIETTARGIHIPSEEYLGVNTRLLQQRSLKEVIGLSFCNQAALFWTKEEYGKAAQLYEQALPYLPEDALMKMFLAFNYLFIGKKGEAKALLIPLKNSTFDYAVSPESIPDDYLRGKVDAEGIKRVFQEVNETRASILEKQAQLKQLLNKYPHFRAGLLQLATTYLQLGRTFEALAILDKYHRIDPNDATVEYYLSALSLERLDYQKAWIHLKRAEKIVTERAHRPKALKALRYTLRALSPE